MGRSISTREQELLAFGNIACREALKDKHLRQITIGDGVYKTRSQINDLNLSLRAHLSDQQQLGHDDEFVRVDLMEDAQRSCTCEILDPEEMMIQAEEAFAEMEIDYAAEITDGSNEEQEELELSLAEFFEQLFKITPDDNTDCDEQYHGICCKEPEVQYRKSRVFGPARQAALLSA